MGPSLSAGKVERLQRKSAAEHLGVEGYTLVVCEKPDAARKISEALSDGKAHEFDVEGVPVFSFTWENEEYVVASVQGHAYSLSDPFGERSVYPVFDVEWYPSYSVERNRTPSLRRISAIKKLAEHAVRFVNACDFDVEGETIGSNVFKYACPTRASDVCRAKFSTLTKGELVAAFRDARSESESGLARAGRARHMIDFVWGVNASRALSQSIRGQTRGYWNVSVGRVQGPTLSFLAEREREIREFVPVPYWKVTGEFEGGGKKTIAEYAQEKVEGKAEAERVRAECLGQEATVTRVLGSAILMPPPSPFNTGDLQGEVYGTLGTSPSKTLQIAEALYLKALISYPRTSSQRIPPSIDCGSILRRLGQVSQYSGVVAELLKGGLKPAQGLQDDPAHPAIHPTGERPPRGLSSAEARVYDLVVRRFLASFAQAAHGKSVEVELSVNGHAFLCRSHAIEDMGWMRYYRRHEMRQSVAMHVLSKGDRLKVTGVEVAERFQRPPPRYNEGSLLEKMEREGIGTKSTRAGIISTLAQRGYVLGRSMEATEFGLFVVEMMQKYAPSLTSSRLTFEVERKLEDIESGKETGTQVIRETLKSVAEQLVVLEEEGETGGPSHIGRPTARASDVLGPCPVCKVGQLRVVKSKKTGKRFVGCSEYGSGCRASAPLPQRGTIRRAAKACDRCSWPVVYVAKGGRPWRLCVNTACPSKKGGTDEV